MYVHTNSYDYASLVLDKREIIWLVMTGPGLLKLALYCTPQ